MMVVTHRRASIRAVRGLLRKPGDAAGEIPSGSVAAEAADVAEAGQRADHVLNETTVSDTASVLAQLMCCYSVTAPAM